MLPSLCLLANTPIHPGLIVLAFVIGLALILAEVALPGVVIGLIGGALVAGSIYFAFSEHSFAFGMTLTAIATVVVPMGVAWLLIKSTLRDRQTAEGGYVAVREELAALIGLRGKTLTPLRPAGTALIGRARVDVVSEGPFIDQGAAIVVAQVDGGRVVVRPEA